MRRRRGADSSEDVAVKSVDLRWLGTSPAEYQRLHPCAIEFPWQDLCILKQLNAMDFPYAVQLHGLFMDNEKAYMMTSFADGGDLFSWSTSSKAAKLGREREALVRPIARSIFEGVQWLHDLGIAHRDLSLENILLTDTRGPIPQVKIIDFGMATLKPRCCRGLRGKRSYQAPEMHDNGFYDGFLADSFALGVMLFGMTSQKYPWRSTQPGVCSAFDLFKCRGLTALLSLRAFRNEEGKLFFDIASGSLKSLLRGLLAIQPHARMTLGEKVFAVSSIERPVSAWESGWW
jgi:serine/threonine protein kinase